MMEKEKLAWLYSQFTEMSFITPFIFCLFFVYFSFWLVILLFAKLHI